MPGNSYILRNFQLKASSLMNGTSWAMRSEHSFAAHLVDFRRRLFEFMSTYLVDPRDESDDTMNVLRVHVSFNFLNVSVFVRP